MSTRTGTLLLVSGPSGSGKTTLCRRLTDEKEVVYATSCTTRAPRKGEVNHVDYHFLTPEEFRSRIDDGLFFEYAEVHGHYYGTLKTEVINHLTNGSDVVIDIDVQGADFIRSCDDAIIQKALITLFVMPHSDAELRKRLTTRGTDTEEIIELRMSNAHDEIKHWKKYDYRLLSTDKETDYALFKSIIHTERLRISRLNNI